jgi:hypothetical protein
MSEIIDGLNAGTIHLGAEDVQMSPIALPITYFEHVPSFSHLNGIVGVCLVVGGVVPSGPDTAITIASVVTNLKCNIPAAIALRDALNGALLLAQPVEKPEGPAN